MKLSDYVIDFLARKGVTCAFGISGGAAVHLFDSIGKHPQMTYCCPSDEQTAAIAADGYARASGKLGVCLTTSGPGATNLLTGTCCSYYDSVPTLALTGQVSTPRLKGDRPVRQVGFQETDVVDIFRSVTKYAVQIADPNTIRYHLEKAYYLAFEGRPGPVLIDLPDDLQRADVNPATMEGFTPPVPAVRSLDGDIDELLALLAKAERPLVILGAGLTTPRIDPELHAFIDAFGLPMLQTWPAIDLLPADHPLKFGAFGVYGPRSGNFAVQNADLILVLGSRLSQNLTGGILPSFAREATIAMVDVDRGELDKFEGRGITIGLRINARLTDFFSALARRANNAAHPNIDAWLAKLNDWKQRFPIEGDVAAPPPAKTVDAYDFVGAISRTAPDNAAFFVDTGGTLTWTLNGIRTKTAQRVFSAWNNTPMGYALPAAIGAAFADRSTPVTCVTGDGGLMLCLGELALLPKHRLLIKVVLFNNHGHGIQKQTLETWLGANYEGVDGPSGLSFVDFPAVATAMGLPVVTIDGGESIDAALARAYAIDGPVFINAEINPNQKLYPVVKFGEPLENQMPLLPPGVVDAAMVIAPYGRELKPA